MLARVASQLPLRERADALVALACASRSLRAMVAQHARPVRLSVRCGCNARDADIRAELGAAVEALGSGARIALVEVTEGPATLCKTGSGLVSLPSLPSAGPSLLSSLHSPSSSSCSSAAAASPSFLQWLADLLRGVAVEALSLETSSRDLLALQRLFRLPAADLVLALTAPPPQLALRALRVRRLTVGTGGGSTTVRVRDMPALERLAAGVLRWGRGEGARLRLLVEDGLPRLAAIKNRSRRITTTWPLEDEPDTGASALHLLCNPPALRVVRWGQVFWGGAPPPALRQLSTPLPGAAVPRHVLAALGALECGAEDSGSGWLTTARGDWPGGLRELHLRVRLPADWDEVRATWLCAFKCMAAFISRGQRLPRLSPGYACFSWRQLPAAARLISTWVQPHLILVT